MSDRPDEGRCFEDFSLGQRLGAVSAMKVPLVASTDPVSC